MSESRGLSMLEAALEIEHKGKAFYEKALQQVKNKLGRAILETLIQEELVHMDRIRMIAASLQQKQAWTEDWRNLGIDKNEIEAIFNKMAREHKTATTADTSDIEVLAMGIDLELESIAFYESHLDLAGDPLEEAFLTQIVAEEKVHHASLEDMVLYLKNPEAWFTEHEHHTLDGA